MTLMSAAKRLARNMNPLVFDIELELITVTPGAVDANGDRAEPTITVVWTGMGHMGPNLPRYERIAAPQPVAGIEERRNVHYFYVPSTAPAETEGIKVRYDGRVYELIKEALPVGGYPPSVWRLDCGVPL